MAVIAAVGIWLHARNAAVDVSNYPYIFPNVYVAGVDVGGLDKQQAQDKVEKGIAESYGVNTLIVRLPDRSLSFAPEAVKFTIDAGEAVDKAYEYGRSGDKYEAYRAYNNSLTNEHYIDVDAAISIDRESIRAIIDEAAADIRSDLVQSSYEITEDSIVVHVGSAERELDADALYETVCNAFLSGDFSTIEFDVRTISPDTIDLDSVYLEINKDVADAYYDEESGEIVPEVVGCTFDLQSEKEMLAIAPENSEYVIRLQITQPKMTAEMLGGKLFAHKLGVCDSELTGSNYNRTNNVTLACEAINGTILYPDDVFSFNAVVGERTEAKGYLEAGVYVGGQTQNELGGGVCQVASAIYLAALRANLEIVEREPHQFLVTYVPMGCDATIYWGFYDFKFENSTEYPLRINTWVEGSYVHCVLYGTNESGEYVEMTHKVLSITPYEEEIEEDPTKPADYSSVKQSPYTGYEVKTYRNLYSADGELIKTTYEAFSNYQVRNKIIVVGAQPEPEPEPEPEPTPEPVPQPIIPPQPDPEPSPQPEQTTPPETSGEPEQPPTTESAITIYG
ncbi:MAG: hypothetical protein E7430_03245 [Ruminococcaceae bacterium]|nr:hypothetical protein [Oscillospiraceae bacterium]